MLSGPLQVPGDSDHGESGDPEDRLDGIVRVVGDGRGRVVREWIGISEANLIQGYEHLP